MQSNPPFLITRILISAGFVRKKPMALPMKSVQDAESPHVRSGMAQVSHGTQPTAGKSLIPSVPTTLKAPGVNGAEVVHTVIPPSMTVVGEIEIGENVVFQGPVRGNITVRGDHQVILTHSSSVHGNISGKAIIIGCQVEGDIDAERVILTEGATVRGAIRYSTLAMAEGARVDGTLTMVIPNVVAEHSADSNSAKGIGIDLGANARVEVTQDEDGEPANVSTLRPAAAARTA